MTLHSLSFASLFSLDMFVLSMYNIGLEREEIKREKVFQGEKWNKGKEPPPSQQKAMLSLKKEGHLFFRSPLSWS